MPNRRHWLYLFHKALGIHWRTTTDTRHVATPQLDANDKPTKRQVLSDVARTFDILGLFIPVTISLKLLLQQIWSLGLHWDELIPSNLAKTWKRWRKELPLVTQYSVPRCYFQPGKSTLCVSLHGFCDSSQAAMAAVVYLRVEYTDFSVSTELVMSKPKVALVKTQTIPKLELSAAVLLAKILNSVQTELQFELSWVHAWSDSMVALGWITTNPVWLKTYVANRVIQITDTIPPVCWRHVPNPTNPADVASRGTTVSDLLKHSLWWHGPDWLLLPPSEWPVEYRSSFQLPELKKYALIIIRTSNTNHEQILELFSSFTCGLDVLSLIFKFISRCRRRKENDSSSVLTREESDSSSGLTLEEIQQTETKLFLLHQKQFYSDELKTLKSGSTLPNTNPLCSLFPILDQAGLIRVGRRLQQTNISYQQKHPIIIYRKSHLALLLVRLLHNSNHHPGPTMMLALLSQQYYMSGARILVRAVCRKEYAKVASQCMGQLPAARITPSPPFTKTGTDFAGPLLLKKGHTRKLVIVKGYVCLFIRLSTRAVHLELVMDLSTDSFLATFRRFTARRGCLNNLYSDNGSNYVGADREL